MCKNPHKDTNYTGKAVEKMEEPGFSLDQFGELHEYPFNQVALRVFFLQTCIWRS